MLRTYVLILSVSLFSMLCFAQPAPVWTHTYGGEGLDRAVALCNALDGGVFVTGYGQQPGHDWISPYTIRIDDEGDSLWSGWVPAQLQDSAYFSGRALTTTFDGGLAIAGGYQTWMRACFLTKVNAMGNEVWTQNYFTSMDMRGVVQTPDSGFCMIGNWFDPNFQSPDAYVFKTDRDGVLQWTHTFGGPGQDSAQAILTMPDGGYVISGSRQVGFMGPSEAWLLRLNADGDTIWTRGYGDSTYSSALSMDRTSDGGFILAGASNFGDQQGSVHMLVIRTDNAGNALWQRHYHIAGTDHDCGVTGVKQLPGGAFVVVGWTHPVDSYWEYDGFIARLNPNGDVMWMQTYGAGNNFGDRLKAVVLAPDSGFYAAGYMGSQGGTADQFFVVRFPREAMPTGIHGTIYDELGVPLEGAHIAIAGRPDSAHTDSLGNYMLLLPPGTYNMLISHPCTARDTMRSLEVPPDSNITVNTSVYRTHYSLGQTSLNMIVHGHTPATSTLRIHNTGLGTVDYSIELVPQSPTGNWLSATPQTGSIRGRDSVGITVRVAPDTTHQVSDYLGFLRIHLNSCPDSVAQVTVAASAVPDAAEPIQVLPARYDISVYPNPFNPATTVSLALPQATKLRLQLFDVNGRAVRSLCDGVYEAGMHRITVDGSSLPSGLYFARWQTPDFTRTQKLFLLK